MDAEQTCREYEYLVPTTLLKMYGNPYAYAKNKHLDYDDLYQFGMIGLWEATQSYPKKQIGTFKNYAIRNIRWSIRKQIILEQRKFSYYKSTTSAYTSKNFEVTTHSMSEYLGDDDKMTFYDTVSCDNITNFINDDSVEMKSLSKVEFDNIMKRLNDMEKEILHLKMEGYSYEQIGAKYGVSRGAIGLRVKTIKSKINRYLEVQNESRRVI